MHCHLRTRACSMFNGALKSYTSSCARPCTCQTKPQPLYDTARVQTCINLHVVARALIILHHYPPPPSHTHRPKSYPTSLLARRRLPAGPKCRSRQPCHRAPRTQLPRAASAICIPAPSAALNASILNTPRIKTASHLSPCTPSTALPRRHF